MFETPFNIIIINPVFDIFIFISLSYFFLFRLYKEMLETDIENISWTDLKISLIFIIVGYLNYQGNKLSFFNLEMDWFAWVILIQLIIEGFFVMIYWEETKIFWKKVKALNKKKRKINLKKEVEELGFIKSFLEEDYDSLLNNAENKKEKEKIEKNINKIENSILSLKEEMEEINLKEEDD